MLTSDRRREIVHRVLADGYVEAKDLSADFGVDSSTIRRDLDALARTGQVQRTHGGARQVPGTAVEVPYAWKQTERRAEKSAIAREAASRVRDGDTVILDSGSTTYEVAVALRNLTNLTLITNDLRIAKYLATTPQARLLVTGGELIGSVFTLAGDRALSFLTDYTADWTFLGADAIHRHAGITNTNTLEVPLKRAMIAAADTTVVVADSSKFGHRTLAKVAALEEVDLIITDNGLVDDAAAAYGARLIRSSVESAC